MTSVVVRTFSPSLRSGPAVEGLLTDWANLIRAEYCEMPGLSLTQRQAARLWQLDQPIAAVLLEHLIDERFLRCTAEGVYIRAEIGPR